jgi:PAS domain S-box-containing protein
MAVEAVRSRGVKVKRLAFAAAGTLAFALTSAAVALTLFGDWARAWAGPVQALNTAGLACYFLAFNPPRWLLGRWRRLEQATYLDQVAEREPEERGWMAAEDLLNGATRCVGGDVTFVALKAQGAEAELVVRAASDRSLIGLVLPVEGSPFAEVTASGQPRAVVPSACGPEVARHLSVDCVTVLIAPLTMGGTGWGVVVAAHRRGALFPDDDLTALVQLARNAAIALEHAALVQERRERARQAANRRLREIEARVDLMLDSIKDYALVVLDASGRVAAWHSGAQHVFGRARETVSGHSAAALFDLDDAAFAAWLTEARERGRTEREGPCRRGDGQSFVGATMIRPLVHEPGTPPGFVLVTRDVTEQRQMEDRLRQGQKMQAIGQLAGGIAHDFNNLLTAILGYADWLERGLKGDTRRSHVLEIQRAGERAADLTRQLLAFSRRQNVQLVSIDLSQLVGDLLPLLGRLIGERITIVDECSPIASPVLGDRSQLEQVVMNLVLNARDAMPGGGRLTIRTAELWFDGGGEHTSVAGGAHVLLEVRDTGIGMDEETRRRAFEPFFTTKDVGQGTGLGLSTVYGIVQQMGGVVEIDSQLGRGATFRLFFPVGAQLPTPGSVVPSAGTADEVPSDVTRRPPPGENAHLN